MFSDDGPPHSCCEKDYHICMYLCIIFSDLISDADKVGVSASMGTDKIRIALLLTSFVQINFAVSVTHYMLCHLCRGSNTEGDMCDIITCHI